MWKPAAGGKKICLVASAIPLIGHVEEVSQRSGQGTRVVQRIVDDEDAHRGLLQLAFANLQRALHFRGKIHRVRDNDKRESSLLVQFHE